MPAKPSTHLGARKPCQDADSEVFAKHPVRVRLRAKSGAKVCFAKILQSAATAFACARSFFASARAILRTALMFMFQNRKGINISSLVFQQLHCWMGSAVQLPKEQCVIQIKNGMNIFVRFM